MTYETILDVNVTGVEDIFIHANNITGAGMFMNGVVIMLYFVFALGMYFAQQRMTGKGDAVVSFAVSGYLMVGFVILIGMIPGMINGFIVTQMIVLATLGTIWLIFSKMSSV